MWTRAPQSTPADAAVVESQERDPQGEGAWGGGDEAGAGVCCTPNPAALHPSQASWASSASPRWQALCGLLQSQGRDDHPVLFRRESPLRTLKSLAQDHLRGIAGAGTLPQGFWLYMSPSWAQRLQVGLSGSLESHLWTPQPS